MMATLIGFEYSHFNRLQRHHHHRNPSPAAPVTNYTFINRMRHQRNPSPTTPITIEIRHHCVRNPGDGRGITAIPFDDPQKRN